MGTIDNLLRDTPLPRMVRVGQVFRGDALADGAAALLAAPRVVRIPNTLHLERLALSEAPLDEAARTPGVEVLGDPQPWAFDAEGNLTDLGRPPAAGH